MRADEVQARGIAPGSLLTQPPRAVLSKKKGRIAFSADPPPSAPQGIFLLLSRNQYVIVTVTPP